MKALGPEDAGVNNNISAYGKSRTCSQVYNKEMQKVAEKFFQEEYKSENSIFQYEQEQSLNEFNISTNKNFKKLDFTKFE